MKPMKKMMRNMKCGMRNVECGMRNDAKRHRALPLFSIDSIECFAFHNSAFSIFTLIIVLALAFSACTSDSFNKRTVIPEAEWRQEDRIAFDVDINDTINGYVFGIGLRHMENYRYSNLFVFLHTRMPNGNLTHDTIECTLATPEGKWIGKSSGSMRDLLVPLNENLLFPLKGTYHFEIEQAMREPTLKGISDIGLYIEKR